MRRALLLVPSIFLLACGSAQPLAASPAGASAASGAAPAAEPCLASISVNPPSTPVEEVGSITLHLGKGVCSIDARGLRGPARPTVSCDSPRNAREAALLAACSLGGDKLWPRTREQAKDAPVMEMVVGRLTQGDPRADLALICAPFTSLVNPATGKTLDASGIDPSQRAVIRASLLAESMTSKQWRLWLHGLRDDREASIATLRAAAKAAGLTCESEWTTSP